MMYCRIALLALACMPSLYAQQTKVDAVRAEKNEAADNLAVELAISSLPQQQKNDDRLPAIILRDSTAHARRDTSEKILRAVEQKFLEDSVHDQLASYALTRPDLHKGWVDEAMKRQHERITKTVQEALNAGFHEQFTRARDIAVNAQRGMLSLHLTPTPGDVESMIGPYRAFADLPLDQAQRRAAESGSPIVAKYVASAHAGQVIFEENETYLRDQATEIFSRKITELWQQLQYIVQHTGGGEIERSRIELVISRGMSSLPSGHSPFPITKTAIHDRAAELEKGLFHAFVKSRLTSPCPALSPAVVLKGVPADPNDLVWSKNSSVGEVVCSPEFAASFTQT